MPSASGAAAVASLDMATTAGAPGYVEGNGSDATAMSVRVALRIRPLVPREEQNGSGVCVRRVPDEQQVVVDGSRAFTYDYVFDQATPQVNVFHECVEPLLRAFFEGYHATIFAYGQTGSGKTFTMGTGVGPPVLNDTLPTMCIDDSLGIIPRVALFIFNEMTRRIQEAKERNRVVPEFQLKCTFLELYNEEFIDLLDPFGRKKKGSLTLQERKGAGGEVEVALKGANETSIESAQELLALLTEGSTNRTTGATDMNAVSSRSHAIFTLVLTQKRQSALDDEADLAGDEVAENGSATPPDEAKEPTMETIISKFHFVDLAGSERLSKTNAVGERAKEGVKINMSLLMLIQVISALAEHSQHVPYRNSQLTRFLQTSLGGNSRTLMIACVSPADVNVDETLSTLRYANDARKIKNKAVVNRDPAAAEIFALRLEVRRLKQQIQQLLDGGADARLLTITNAPLLSGSNKRVQQLEEQILELQQEVARFKQEKRMQAMQDEAAAIFLRYAADEESNNDDAPRHEIARHMQSYIERINQQQAQIEELERVTAGFSYGKNAQPQPTRSVAKTGAVPTVTLLSPPTSRPKCVSRKLIDMDPNNVPKHVQLRLVREIDNHTFWETASEQLFNKAAKTGAMDLLRATLIPTKGHRRPTEGFRLNVMLHLQVLNTPDRDDLAEVDELDDISAQQDDVALDTTEETRNAATQKRLEHRLDRIQRSIHDKQAESQKWEQDKKEFEARIAALVLEKKQMMRELERANSKRTRPAPDKDADALRMDYEKKITELSKEINDKQNKFLEYQRMLQKQKQTEAKLNMSLNAALADLQHLRTSTVQRLRDTEKALKTAKSTADREIKTLHKRDTQKATEISKLQRLNESLRRQLDVRTQETSQLRQRLRSRANRTGTSDGDNRFRRTTLGRFSGPQGLQQNFVQQQKAALDDEIQRCVYAQETAALLPFTIAHRDRLSADVGAARVLVGASVESAYALQEAEANIDYMNKRIEALQADLEQSSVESSEAASSISSIITNAPEPDLRMLLHSFVQDSIAQRYKTRSLQMELVQLAQSQSEQEKQVAVQRATFTSTIQQLEAQIADLRDRSIHSGGKPPVISLITPSPDTPRSNINSGATRFNTSDDALAGASASMPELSTISTGPRPRAPSHNDVFSRLTAASPSQAATKASEEVFVHGPPLHGAVGRHVEATFVLRGHTGSITDVGVDSTTRTLVTASKDAFVRRWDLLRQALVSEPWQHDGPVLGLAVSPRVVVTSSDKMIRVYDPLVGLVNQWLVDGTVTTLRLHPNDHFLYSSSTFSADGTLSLWDLRKMPVPSGRRMGAAPGKVHGMPLRSRAKSPMYAIVIRPESSLVYAAARNNKLIHAYDDSSLEQTGTLQPAHFDEVRSLALHDRWLYSAGGASGAASFVRRWNVGSGTDSLSTVPSPVSAIHAHKEGIKAVVAHPQTGALISSDRDGMLKLWEPPTPQSALDSVVEWKAHGAGVNALAFLDSAGRDFVSGSDDKTVRGWRLR